MLAVSAEIDHRRGKDASSDLIDRSILFLESPMRLLVGAAAADLSSNSVGKSASFRLDPTTGCEKQCSSPIPKRVPRSNSFVRARFAANERSVDRIVQNAATDLATDWENSLPGVQPGVSRRFSSDRELPVRSVDQVFGKLAISPNCDKQSSESSRSRRSKSGDLGRIPKRSSSEGVRSNPPCSCRDLATDCEGQCSSPVSEQPGAGTRRSKSGSLAKVPRRLSNERESGLRSFDRSVGDVAADYHSEEHERFPWGMDDSVTSSFEITNLTKKIWKSCMAARTRRSQCLVLSARCSQLDGYVLAWRTGSCREDFSNKGGLVMAEMVCCFKRALTLVTECGCENWLQQGLVRQHGEQEFRRVFEDLEMVVEIMSGQVISPSASREAIHQKILSDRCDIRDELREAAKQDRHDLLSLLTLAPPELDTVSGHLLHRLKNSEVVPDDLGFEPLNVDQKTVVCETALGKGASGTVYRGRWLNHPVAIKVFKPDDLTFEKEVQAMSELVRPHPHVLQMFCFARSQHEQMIIMELMKMDLKKFLDRRRNLPVLTSVDILLQIARGTRHLHEHRIVHRDLKPQNVLVDFDEGDQSGGSINVLLTDFGISRTEFDTLAGDAQLTHLRGTPRYMAPEMLLGEADRPRYSRKVDVFSFAILSSEVLTGSPPYGQENPDMSRLKTMLTAGRRPQLPETCPEDLTELITRCWDSDSDKRPTFAEIEMELMKIKKKLLTPPPSFTPYVPHLSHISSIGQSSSSSTSSRASTVSPSSPSIEELVFTGTVEVGSTISVNFRPKNGAKYCICRWVRRGGSSGSSEIRKPVMLVFSGSREPEAFGELDLTLTAADFRKRLVLECLPLSGVFRTGRVASKSTGVVGYKGEEAIKTSWENGQASFKVVRLHPKWWESTGKLFINRKDYYLWWGQGNPQNLRFLFADARAEDRGAPLELSEEDPLLCNLRKSDGSLCVVKFTSPSARDNAVLAMKYFWEKRREPT